MSEHTPGPWRLETMYGDQVVMGDNTDGGQVQAVIATINHTGYLYAATRTANARLIAAAPDLLDMLEMLCDGLEWNIDNNILMNESDSEALVEVRTFIHKVRGE